MAQQTTNRHHARYLSDHPPLLESPGDEIGKTNSNPVFSTQSVYPVILVLPTCLSLSFHVINARCLGRGFTEYKVHSQRLSSLPFWGERRWSVNIKMKCVYNYCLQRNCVLCVPIPVPLICNQSIPINLSTGIDNQWNKWTEKVVSRCVTLGSKRLSW